MNSEKGQNTEMEKKSVCWRLEVEMELVKRNRLREFWGLQTYAVVIVVVEEWLYAFVYKPIQFHDAQSELYLKSLITVYRVFKMECRLISEFTWVTKRLYTSTRGGREEKS